VKIVSFGVYEVIRAYCDRALGEGKMTRREISTPSVVGVKDGCSVDGGKNPQMQRLCEEKYGAEDWRAHAERAVLFDDDERNVVAARTAGFRAVHTPAGFTRESASWIFDATE